MSYFVERVNQWRNAWGKRRSVIETVAEFGDNWVDFDFEGDPFERIYRNAWLMMGWELEERPTRKEPYITFCEVLDR